MENKGILPVTNEIRNYLRNQLSNEEVERELKKYGFSKEIYKVIKGVGKTIIANKDNEAKNKKETIQEKIIFLKDIARKMDKSLIWIYQELVLSGYGEYIDEDSDIYKAALLANKDVQNILKKSTEEYALWYEDFCVLNGTAYDEKVKPKKLVRQK